MRDTELLFAKNDLSEVLRAHELKALEAIDSFNPDKLLNSIVEDLVQYFISEFLINPIQIIDDQVNVDQVEAKMDLRHERIKAYYQNYEPVLLNGTRVTLYVPYDGDKNLLFCQASTYSLNPPRAIVLDKEIRFVLDGLDHDAKYVKSAFDGFLKSLREQLEWTNRDVNQFNAQLPQKIRQKIEQRKEKLLAARGMVASLGFPLKQRDGAPATYAAPVSRKKIPSLLSATAAPFKPEPALEMVVYDQILGIMQSMVTVMERSPSAFRTMKEEDLRQHFLVQLNSQFEGQATGETFNYQGKTDILIRVNDRNIFIAECKFWKSPKTYAETIDQLLGYLSWRDTKSAILIFNRNKTFSDVVNAIPALTKSHPNFKRELPRLNETSTRYIFNQKDDPNRELYLTVMAFNIPGKE
jgi:hypothetical protein